MAYQAINSLIIISSVWANFNKMELETGYCLECKKKKEIETDIQLCEKCMNDYDTDRLWADHDNNKIDALDFNESEKVRQMYRKEAHD